jgi:FMN reductase
MQLGIIVGNPNPRSRTLGLAEAVGDAVGAVVGETSRFVVDLIDLSAGLFTWGASDVAELVDTAARTDFLVVASPTYKAAYTGLLKAFLDRFDSNGLEGVVAIPVMTGGSPHHSLAPDTTLRPLLVELGASVPTRSLYFVTSEDAEVIPAVDAWAEANRTALLGAAHARRGG